ncbi:1-acyl-sn-glycerol-3-phosphate acyltransferase [Kibdelosporangium aridum]|uniref:lysophospholipid acyltransferase family protein n=1 Tax=Kibdelosporangium aridum TaxID=2030 RepID=UPI000A93231F|nr:lysophospholipid acyltransferase family protein [Kibdelosporangium aridum]
MVHKLPPVGLPRRVARCLAGVCVLVVLLCSTRRTVRWTCRLLLRALGVKLAAPAQIPPGTLLAANHISWLDAVAVLAVEPVTFLAKQEVATWPIIGRVIRRVGTRFIHREGLRALPLTIGVLADELRHGRTVAVFPGGTTWCGPPGGRFRRAAFQAALDARAPVRPVTISYTQGGRPSTVPAFVGGGSLVASLWQVVRARDLIVRVDVHDPVDHGLTTFPPHARRELADAAYQAISASADTSPL